MRIEVRCDTEISELWSAITDPARLSGWYAKVEGDLRPGGQFLIFVESDDWQGTGRVEACEAPRRLVVTTRESDDSWQKGQGVPPYDKTLEATLAADGGHTVLVIEVKGMPLDAVAFYGAGWQIHAESLAAYLAGRERSDTQPRWDELVPVYQALAADID
ncbi:MAG: SRPBCC domain-containing protein [Acidimicrobiales bacterium]